MDSLLSSQSSCFCSWSAWEVGIVCTPVHYGCLPSRCVLANNYAEQIKVLANFKQVLILFRDPFHAIARMAVVWHSNKHLSGRGVFS